MARHAVSLAGLTGAWAAGKGRGWRLASACACRLLILQPRSVPARHLIGKRRLTVPSQHRYRNAGTVEFMVCGEDYYFLEVNPRIQVEHTVTEEVTGVDLVQSQIRVAGGASLAEIGFAAQADVPPLYGFAIQCRITSEVPELDFQVPPCPSSLPP